MSEDNKYNVTDLLQAAVNSKPNDFENVFGDLMLGRIQNAINNRKVEIAQNMFRDAIPEEDELESDEQDLELDSESDEEDSEEIETEEDTETEEEEDGETT